MQNPRDSWTPAMAHYFHRQPETMLKLRPSELSALVEGTQAQLKAASGQ